MISYKPIKGTDIINVYVMGQKVGTIEPNIRHGVKGYRFMVFVQKKKYDSPTFNTVDQLKEAIAQKYKEFCVDCGQEGKLTGHQDCPYPRNH